MLVELRLVEQRSRAVLEVLNDGATVTDVARRYGVARQTVAKCRSVTPDALIGRACIGTNGLRAPSREDADSDAQCAALGLRAA